jgi:hypothetical protein
MAAVYVSNLVINCGADFSQSFTLEGTETNSALNLTGYTVQGQIRKHAGSSTAISFTTSIITPATTGRIVITLTAAQTSTIKPGRYVYDIVVTDASSYKTRVVEGMVLVREGVTR